MTARRYCAGPSLRGEAVAASTAASPWLPMYAALFCWPKSPPVFDISEAGAAGYQNALEVTSARRRYRAACPSPAPPRFPSASRANPLAARAAPLPGSMPMMASKSSMALSNRATYMRAMPLL